MRRRLIDHVWMEEISVINHRHESSTIEVALELDTDFADLFEVKDGTVEARDVAFRHDDRSLALSYERDGFRRSVTIASSLPAVVTREGFAYSPTLAPGEQWSTTFTITPGAEQSGVAFGQRHGARELQRHERIQIGRAGAVAGPARRLSWRANPS